MAEHRSLPIEPSQVPSTGGPTLSDLQALHAAASTAFASDVAARHAALVAAWVHPAVQADLARREFCREAIVRTVPADRVAALMRAALPAAAGCWLALFVAIAERGDWMEWLAFLAACDDLTPYLAASDLAPLMASPLPLIRTHALERVLPRLALAP